jgi:hypothetical protein
MNRPQNPKRAQENKVESPAHSIMNATRIQVIDVLNADKAVLEMLGKSDTFNAISSNQGNLKSITIHAWKNILGEISKSLGKGEALALFPQIKEWATQKGIQNLDSAASKFNPNAVPEIDMEDPEQVKNAYDQLKSNLLQIEELELKNKKLSDDMRKTGDLDLSQDIDENLDSINALTEPYQSTEEARDALANLRNALEDLGYQLEE